MPLEMSNQISVAEKRKILARLLAEGDGVIDYNKMSKDNSPSDVREYLSMLPLGQPVLIGGGIMRVAEYQGRPDSSIPDDMKQYYKNKNYKNIRTLK
jgi:hypothetical protein